MSIHCGTPFGSGRSRGRDGLGWGSSFGFGELLSPADAFVDGAQDSVFDGWYAGAAGFGEFVLVPVGSVGGVWWAGRLIGAFEVTGEVRGPRPGCRLGGRPGSCWTIAGR
jgi:hypothetical protein